MPVIGILTAKVKWAGRLNGELALADDFHKGASSPALVEFAAEDLFPRAKGSDQPSPRLRLGRPAFVPRLRDYGLAGE